MDTSEKFSQQQFKELLEDIYIKGQESEFIKIEEFLIDIENKLITLLEIPHVSNY